MKQALFITFLLLFLPFASAIGIMADDTWKINKNNAIYVEDTGNFTVTIKDSDQNVVLNLNKSDFTSLSTHVYVANVKLDEFSQTGTYYIEAKSGERIIVENVELEGASLTDSNVFKKAWAWCSYLWKKSMVMVFGE